MARQKLTDKQKKRMIAEYVDCGNYSAVARKFKVSVTTVRHTVKSDTESLKKFHHKKEENTASALEWLDSNTQKILSKCEMIINSIDEASIKSVPLNLRTVAFGTLLDKVILPLTNKIPKSDDDTSFETNRKTVAQLITENQTVTKDD